MPCHLSHGRDLFLGGRTFKPGDTALLAIINRTPDSFYDAGRYLDDDVALSAVAQAVADGADAVDVGGVKAGPGPEVSAAEELGRVVTFIAAVREAFPELVLSVDTWRAGVADAPCDAGADLINDAWAGQDAELAGVAGAHRAGCVCAHTGGHPPRTDRHRVRYE